MKKIINLAALSALLLATSCRNDDPVTPPVLSKGAYENGILIANEGNFGKPNAEVSFADPSLNAISNGIYGASNSAEPLGDVLQSIAFSGDKAYLVVNNSNKIVVANRYTFKKQAVITDQVEQPRYAAISGNYLYVTNAGKAKSLSIYNKADNSFVKSIAMPGAAERVVEAGGNIFVQNASYGYGNQITYVSTSDNTLKSTITVPAGQISKTISYSGSVYTLAADSKNSYIYQYSSTGQLTKTTTLAGIANGANLSIDQNKFYFTSGTGVYAMDMSASAAPSAPLFRVADNSFSTLYGFEVIDGKIYTSDAQGFTANSIIKVYDASGSLLKTFTAGMGTNGFYKN